MDLCKPGVWIWALGCLFMGLLPHKGAAQPDLGGITEVYATAGVTHPISPSRFRTLWDTGNHMTAGIGFDGAGVFVLRLGIRYNSFGLDTSAVAASEEISDPVELPENPQYHLAGTTFDLLLDVPSPVRRLSPYLLVGLTIYYTNLSDMAIEEDLSQRDIDKQGQLSGGMNVGVGLSHTMTPDVKAFAEYMLIGAFAGGDKKVFTPLSVGLSVQI